MTITLTQVDPNRTLKRDTLILKAFAPYIFSWFWANNENHSQDVQDVIQTLEAEAGISISPENVITVWNQWADEDLVVMDDSVHLNGLKSALLTMMTQHPLLTQYTLSHAEMIKEAVECEECDNEV